MFAMFVDSPNLLLLIATTFVSAIYTPYHRKFGRGEFYSNSVPPFGSHVSLLLWTEATGVMLATLCRSVSAVTVLLVSAGK
jgi:hypothetical protein